MGKNGKPPELKSSKMMMEVIVSIEIPQLLGCSEDELGLVIATRDILRKKLQRLSPLGIIERYLQAEKRLTQGLGTGEYQAIHIPQVI